MVTAIVTSDNHLGAYYARLRPDRLEQRRRILQGAFEHVVEAALEQRVDLFLHAGDLFDRPEPRNVERAGVARQVRRLRDAGIPMFAIAGNHDSPRAGGYEGAVLPHEALDVLGGLHLFKATTNFECATLTVRGLRVAVWGMSSDFNRPDESCPLTDCPLPKAPAADCALGLLHYAVEGWTPALTREPVLALANLDRLPFDAICVGHLHARAQRRLPGGALLLNPGATEHINFGEERLECGYWLLRLEAQHVEAEYIPLSTQPMCTLDMAFEPAAAAGGGLLGDTVATAITAVAQSDQMLRVRLAGALDRERWPELDLAALQALGNTLNFHCQLDTTQLRIVDAMADFAVGYGVSFDVAEELRGSLAALAENAGDDEAEREILRLAGASLAQAYERLSPSG